jgi:hypothetical protein
MIARVFYTRSLNNLASSCWGSSEVPLERIRNRLIQTNATVFILGILRDMGEVLYKGMARLIWQDMSPGMMSGSFFLPQGLSGGRYSVNKCSVERVDEYLPDSDLDFECLS